VALFIIDERKIRGEMVVEEEKGEEGRGVWISC